MTDDKKKLWLRIGLAALLAVIVAIIVIVLVKRGKKQPDAATSSTSGKGTTPAKSCDTHDLTKRLSSGSKGCEVKALQKAMNGRVKLFNAASPFDLDRVGIFAPLYYPDYLTTITVDGDFGPKTENLLYQLTAGHKTSVSLDEVPGIDMYV